jgi:hypothetical protein
LDLLSYLRRVALPNAKDALTYFNIFLDQIDISPGSEKNDFHIDRDHSLIFHHITNWLTDTLKMEYYVLLKFINSLKNRWCRVDTMSDSSRLMLIIGIDVYENNDLYPLPSCKKDAKDVSTLLAKLGFENFEDSPIIGSEIIENKYSWAILREKIINFFNQAKYSQTLLFYYSGHGIHGKGDIFLATPQVEPKNPSSRGFSFSELEKSMGTSKSRKIVGIIDSCYSGAAGLPSLKLRRKSAKDDAKQALATFDKLWKDTPKTENRCLLLSSQSYESSIAIENSNSLYTKYLLKGLQGVNDRKGKDGTLIPGSIDQYGNVTPQSLHNYLYWTIGELADGQIPRWKTDASSEIVLAHYEHLVKPEVTYEAESTGLVVRPATKEFDSLLSTYRDQHALVSQELKRINDMFMRGEISERELDTLRGLPQGSRLSKGDLEKFAKNSTYYGIRFRTIVEIMEKYSLQDKKMARIMIEGSGSLGRRRYSKTKIKKIKLLMDELGLSFSKAEKYSKHRLTTLKEVVKTLKSNENITLDQALRRF